jgi:hypothetical protein
VREQVAAKNDALRAKEAQMREQAKIQNYLQGKAMLEAALKDSNLSDAEKADIKEHAKTNGMAAGEIYDRWQPDKKGRGYIAGTFQNTISWNLDYLYLIDAPSPTDTLVHELVHVRQYRDRGVFELLFTGFQYQLWEIMGWDTHDRNTGVWAERDAFSCQEHFLNGGNLSEPPCSLGDK